MRGEEVQKVMTGVMKNVMVSKIATGAMSLIWEGGKIARYPSSTSLCEKALYVLFSSDGAREQVTSPW